MTTVPNDPQRSNAPRRGWVKWLVVGCGSMVILICVLAAALWFGVKKATAGPEKVVREFLSAGAAGDYPAAHDYFSAPLKQEQPYAEFVNSVRANSQFFDITHTSFSNRSVDTAGAELSGTVTLKSGSKVPASFKLIKENEQWKLLGYHIGS